MIIPLEQLTSETLSAIIENFVLREGTEYGSEDVSLNDKITQVHQQLKQGTALLVYCEYFTGRSICRRRWRNLLKSDKCAIKNILSHKKGTG